MVSNRITEGVGKKIVEALKQQSDIEIQNVVENPVPVAEEHPAPAEDEIIYNEEEPIYETTNEEVVVNQENTEEEPVKENYDNYLKLLMLIQEELPEILNEVYMLLITLINDKKLNKVATRKSLATITKDNKMFIVTFNIILLNDLEKKKNDK